MSAIITTIADAEDRAAFVCSNIFTSSVQETNAIKITGTALAFYNDGNQSPAPTPILGITRILYAITAGCSVQVIFDGATPETACVLTGSGQMDFAQDGLTIYNHAVSPTGNILFTTYGFASGGTYTLVVAVNKEAGY